MVNLVNVQCYLAMRLRPVPLVPRSVTSEAAKRLSLCPRLSGKKNRAAEGVEFLVTDRAQMPVLTSH